MVINRKKIPYKELAKVCKNQTDYELAWNVEDGYCVYNRKEPSTSLNKVIFGEELTNALLFIYDKVTKPQDNSVDIHNWMKKMEQEIVIKLSDATGKQKSDLNCLLSLLRHLINNQRNV